MKTNLMKEGALTENSAGIGTVTRKMVRERALELAIINGSWLHHASASDFAQAKRQLTGEPDMAAKEAALESAPESERWDPVPGSTGHKVRWPPATTRTRRGGATTNGSPRKVSPEPSTIKWSKPPWKPRALTADWFKPQRPAATAVNQQ